MEKKVKVTKDNIEVVINRNGAEVRRGWKMLVWRWHQGRRGDDLRTHLQGCCFPASGSLFQKSRVLSMA